MTRRIKGRQDGKTGGRRITGRQSGKTGGEKDVKEAISMTGR